MASHFNGSSVRMPVILAPTPETTDRIGNMGLDEIRRARALTQEHLARALGVRQSAVSKMERRADMYVSTLQDCIEAMGGQLEILAVFPEGTVRITQFRDLRGGANERVGEEPVSVGGEAAADAGGRPRAKPLPSRRHWSA